MRAFAAASTAGPCARWVLTSGPPRRRSVARVAAAARWRRASRAETVGVASSSKSSSSKSSSSSSSTTADDDASAASAAAKEAYRAKRAARKDFYKSRSTLTRALDAERAGDATRALAIARDGLASSPDNAHLATTTARLVVACATGGDAVFDDYLLSNKYWEMPTDVLREESDEVRKAVFTADTDYLEAAFTAMSESYGSAESFIQNALGLTPARREDVLAQLVE